MNFQRFWAVFVCRNWEFLRDRSTLTWNLLFPISLIAGFAVAFSGPGLALYKVGVLGDAASGGGDAFFKTRYVQFIPFVDLPAALPKVERHQLDMLVDPVGRRYWINEESPKGYVLERVLRHPTRAEAEALGDLPHRASFGGNAPWRHLAKPHALARALLRPRAIREAFDRAYWRAGFRARLGPVERSLIGG